MELTIFKDLIILIQELKDIDFAIWTVFGLRMVYVVRFHILLVKNLMKSYIW